MTCACASGAHGEGPALATAFAAVLPSGCAASRRQSTARTPRFLSVARSSSLISNGPSRSLLRYRERLRRPRASGPPRRPDPRAVGPRRCRRRHGRHHRPGVLSLVATGRQVLDFYAATDTLLDTFGNHEFDYGPDPFASSSTTRPRRSSPRTSATRTATRSAATRVSSRGRFAGSTAQLSGSSASPTPRPTL